MNADRRELVDPALTRAARDAVWWMPPEETLAPANEILFLNQAMQFGGSETLLTIRKHFDDERLRCSLHEARPGIFDRRSWAYWHNVLGMGAPPPLPVRRIPGVDPADMPQRVWPEDYQRRRG